MNLSVICKSLSYINTSFDLIVQVAVWINHELVKSHVTDPKIKLAIWKRDTNIVKITIPYIKDVASFVGTIEQNMSDDLIMLLVTNGISCDANTLDYCCWRSNYDLVKEIMERNKINIDRRAMIYAARSGSVKIMDLLISYGGLLDGSVLAEAYKSIDLVRYLINEKNLKPTNELFERVSNENNFELVKFLVVEKNFKPSMYMKRKIINSNATIDVIEPLIEIPVDDWSYWNLLRKIIRGNKINLLIEVFRPDLCGENVCGLSLACEKSNLEIVNFFLENKVAPSIKTLIAACVNDNFDISKTIIDLADVDFYEAIEKATENGKFEVLRYILETKPNFKNLKWTKNIRNLIRYGKLDIIKNVFHTETYSNMILYAIEYGHVHIIKFFLHVIDFPELEKYIKKAELFSRFEILEYLQKRFLE